MALFDAAAHEYDQWCETPLGAFTDELEKDLLCKAALPAKEEIALDIGCGTGIYSYFFAAKGVQVTGIDLSKEMLKVAESKREDAYPVFVQGDIHQLPFEDKRFDLVFSNITLEFVSNPGAVFAEVMRVLKPGGRFACGFIGKHSSWGQRYKKQGTDKPGSVFEKAVFYDEQDLHLLTRQVPEAVFRGLYLFQEEFMSNDQAWDLEQKRRLTANPEDAGYFSVRWRKEIHP